MGAAVWAAGGGISSKDNLSGSSMYSDTRLSTDLDFLYFPLLITQAADDLVDSDEKALRPPLDGFVPEKRSFTTFAVQQCGSF
eukprot:m.197638 g.197638  ORF g.197638 m.197638 type:complete len:83 (+) comp18350_c0_seq9:359-607(+)